MSVRVKIEFDKNKLTSKISTNSERATLVLANEVLKDSNFYIKQESGELKRSGLKFSRPTEGKIIWSTPYARRQYWTGRAKKVKNPNASKMWFHVAKSRKKTKWRNMVAKIVKKGV